MKETDSSASGTGQAHDRRPGVAPDGPPATPWANAVTILTILGLLAALAVPVIANRFRAPDAAPARAATPR